MKKNRQQSGPPATHDWPPRPLSKKSGIEPRGVRSASSAWAARRAGWRRSSSSSPTCPPDTGLAFVLVPHLEPTHKGMMPELLGRHTKMKVVEAEDGMEVQPNHVYVIPPNADLAILHGKLQVLEPAAPRGLRMPIDFFFRQLAADQKEKAIGIILSGMGSDGTLGLKAIKENFGMAMVQDPASAKYDGMPRSAINTGLVDYVAPAEELPAKLIQYVNHTPRPPKIAICPRRNPPPRCKRCLSCCGPTPGTTFPATRTTRSAAGSNGG